MDRNFFTDGCLKSVSTAEEMLKITVELRSLLKTAGFHFGKILSNSTEVTGSVPESDRAPQVAILDIDGRAASKNSRRSVVRCFRSIQYSSDYRRAFSLVEMRQAKPYRYSTLLDGFSGLFCP